MAANRKLLTEIQQVLKKMEEGVEVFDSIWEKVYAAESQSLKEKYEADLKKEIKKLQRLRDQIKSWISSGDIKDKTQLLEARRTIESKMEQFKICEKDTKTKAYSKEGLAREARLDPKEAAREEKRVWINECIEQLQDLVNTVELEKEKILLNTKAKNKNKELLEKCDNRISKHKWHISRLELIIKLLDHEELDPSGLDSVKDSLDYYIESAADDDGAYGVEHEFDIYEDLGLDALGAAVSFDLPPRHNNHKDEEDVRDEDHKVATNPVTNVITATGKVNVPTGSKKEKKDVVASAQSTPKPVSSGSSKSKDKEKEEDTGTVRSVTKASPKIGAQGAPSVAAVVAGTHSSSSTTPLPQAANTPQQAQQIVPQPSQQPVLNSVVQSVQNPSTAVLADSVGASTVQSPNVQVASPSTPSTPAVEVCTPNPSSACAVAPGVTATTDSDDMNSLAQSISSLQMANNMLPENRLQNSVGGAPSSTLSSNASTPTPVNTMPPELAAIYNQLKISMTYTDFESERGSTSSYVPRNRYNYAHPSFPTQPLFSTPAETQALFDKINLDTQFFCFYFQQASYAQYLAAKRLRRSSWRFHKKYSTWFQRHSEPKVATDDFEEGTYVYFDYEAGWCQRIKSDFKFEYAFLEDEVAI
eukprot:gene10757-11956_t